MDGICWYITQPFRGMMIEPAKGVGVL